MTFKTCSVIYPAGAGGNFLRLALSLSPECVPYYTVDIDTLDDDSLLTALHLSTADRFELTNLQTIADFNKIHTGKFAEPKFAYSNPLIEQTFSWSIVSNHPDNAINRLPDLNNVIYIDVDSVVVSDWINTARAFFLGNNACFGTSYNDELTINIIKQFPGTLVISGTNLISGPTGVIEEYYKICEFLGITPVKEWFSKYYINWFKLRVLPFI